MIWLTWRLSRLEFLIGGVVLFFVAAYLLWTGLEMSSYYRDAGLPGCAAQPSIDQACQIAASGFLQRFHGFRGFEMVLWLCLPFLVGLLLAAPTVIEFEQGMHRLAWMQGVTRHRWLANKVAVGVGIAVGAAAALTALWTWWLAPFDELQGRFGSNGFDFEGLAPIAYTVFAFALCLSLGTIMRRSVPAMGIGLVVFLMARAVVSDQLRPRFRAPVRLTWNPTATPLETPGVGVFGDGSWIISEEYVDAAGRVVPFDDATVTACMKETTSKSGDLFLNCLHDRGVMSSIVFHPADRFWTFQGMESAIFLGVAAGLLALTSWWVVRRLE